VREGFAIVRSDTATFEQLQWATVYNKKGTRGTRLSLRFEINQGGDQASVHVVALWAALRQAGSIHLVRAASPLPHCCFPFITKMSALPPACRRASVLDSAPHQAFVARPAAALYLQVFGWKVLLQVVRRIPGQENYSIKLVQALQDRISTWLLPAYGYSKEEELGTLSPEDLQGTF
jgi:hypothetical protein